MAPAAKQYQNNRSNHARNIASQIHPALQNQEMQNGPKNDLEDKEEIVKS